MKVGEVRVKTRESLRFKLTLYFVLLTFIPLVALSIIAYTITRSQLEKQLSSALQLTATETQDKIDRFIYQKLEDVISWSRYPILKGAISFGITDIVEAYLQNNLSALSEYKGLALFNRDGEEVASVGEASLLEKGRDQSSAVWFKKTLNEGYSIAEPVKYKDEVRLGISAVVIDLETKEVIGVLLAELDFANVKEITAPVKVTPNPQD